MSRRDEPPPVTVLVAGGVGVLVVLAFVGALAFGAGARSTPGELVRVVRADGPAGLAVLAGRCLDQRVRSVTVLADGAADGGDAVLWRVVSRKGSIARRYVVGGEPPLGFEVDRPLAQRPAGTVRAEVTFARDGTETTDARTVAVADVPEEAGLLEDGAPACSGDTGPGATTLLFALAAAVVVVGYGALLLRLRRR